jgi:hypothetical protein
MIRITIFNVVIKEMPFRDCITEIREAVRIKVIILINSVGIKANFEATG